MTFQYMCHVSKNNKRLKSIVQITNFLPAKCLCWLKETVFGIVIYVVLLKAVSFG